MAVRFELKKVEDENTGQSVDTLLKIVSIPPHPESEEVYCTVLELESLFKTCETRWGGNWNLEKLQYAIMESDVD